MVIEERWSRKGGDDLSCIKDWEASHARLEHMMENKELEAS